MTTNQKKMLDFLSVLQKGDTLKGVDVTQIWEMAFDMVYEERERCAKVAEETEVVLDYCYDSQAESEVKFESVYQTMASAIKRIRDGVQPNEAGA